MTKARKIFLKADISFDRSAGKRKVLFKGCFLLCRMLKVRLFLFQALSPSLNKMEAVSECYPPPPKETEQLER